MILRPWLLRLTVALALTAGPSPARAADLSPYTGEFEIYTGDNYTRITIAAEGDELVSRENGRDEAIRLSPVAGEADAFASAEAGGKDACLYRFQPGAGGEFRLCRLECGQRSLEAIRIAPGTAWTCDPEHRFPVDELREDLRQLWRFIETEHPAVYAFTTEEQFARILAERERGLVRPLRTAEFMQLAAPLIARVGCGHTRLITPQGFWSTQPDRFFPLELGLLIDGVFVRADHGGSGLVPPGSEIVTINGEDVADLVASLGDQVTTDGFNLTARRARLGQNFAFRYALTRGFPETFRVEYRAPGRTEPARAGVPPITQQRLTEGLSRQVTALPLELELLAGGSVARMTIRSFGFYDEVDTFKSFVDSSLAKVRAAGIEDLILDLRGNAGGDPWCTTHLLSYLIREPVPYFAKEYGPYAPLAKPLARAARPYEGRLYVLTDGNCFSSTGHFCSLLKHHRIGAFVGEETGGGHACNDGSKTVELRHTRVRLNLPRVSFVAAVEGLERGRGLQPDYPVEPTGADLAAGRDPVLERALALAVEAAAK